MIESIDFLFNDFSAGPYIPDVSPAMRELAWTHLRFLRTFGPGAGAIFMTAVMLRAFYGLGGSRAHAEQGEEKDREESL